MLSEKVKRRIKIGIVLGLFGVGCVSAIIYGNNLKLHNSAQQANVTTKTDESDKDVNSLDDVITKTKREPSTGKNTIFKPKTDALPQVPKDRSKIDFDKYGAVDYPEGRPKYDGDLKYTSIDVLSVNFGGDPNLAESIGTKDMIGKDIIISIKQKFNQDEYKDLGNVEADLPPIYLISPDGQKFRVVGLFGTFSGEKISGFYGSLLNADVSKIKPNIPYKVSAENSSDYKVTLRIPENLEVTLTY